MRVLLVLAVLLLAVLGAFLAVDRRADELLREGLSRFGFDDLVAVDAVRLDPAGRRVVVHGARLRDPVGGRIVAQIDEVVVEFPTGWTADDLPIPTALRGRGGQAVVRWDEAGEELTVVTAIVELVHRVLALIPEDAPSRPLLPMTFDDLDVVVYAPNHPLERLSGVSVSIHDGGPDVQVAIQPGPGQGEVDLVFGPDGFSALAARSMRVSPTLMGIVPAVGWFLADGLGPRGLLDVEVAYDGALTVQGHVREASFVSPHVPFTLGPADASFRVIDERLLVDDAEVGFDGGSVRVSMVGPIDDLDVRLDVRHARFREDFLRLVPAYGRIERLKCHDGGSFELGLSLRANLTDPDAPLTIDGQGGFHIGLVDLTLAGPVPLRFTDVVGRFRVTEKGLELPDVSARLARGSVRGSGQLDVRSGAYDVHVGAQDLDVARLHAPFHEGCLCEHTVSGWMQGDAELSGVIGEDRLPVGRGQVAVRAGDLWESPLIEAVLLALPDQDEVPRDSQSVQLEFFMGEQRLEIERVRIASDLLTLAADGGSVDRDGNIRLRLRVFQLPFGAVGRVVEFITQQLLLEVQVEGTLTSPVVTPLPVPVVTGPIRSFVNGVIGFFSPDEPPAPDADG